MSKKKFPITRVNKFYDEMDFQMENEMAREYLEGDLNMVVVLFRVDKVETDKIGDDVYGEVDGDKIKFKPPVELNVRVTLEEASNDTYSEGYLRYQDYGNLTFTIFMDHLKELGVDVQYGDYIGYPDREDNLVYFTVINDGKINSDNAHTRLGYKSYYRTIICTKADTNEFDPNI
jgi:hypothetical protein